MAVTEELAQFVSGMTFDSLPPEAVAASKGSLLDWLGCALGGSKEPLARLAGDALRPLGGAEQASVIGGGYRTSILNAALLNGIAGNALDFDDMHIGLFGHPSAPVAPAALAMAEWRRSSGKALITAYVAGIEVECRLGNAVNPAHYYHGWHATGTLGHFGAAAAAAKLLDLGEERTLYALGLAGAQAAGIRQSLGTMARPLHSGKAAANGLLAALLAERGFTAPASVIEGLDGFCQTFAPEWRPEVVTEGLGKTFEIEKVLLKRYASCFETHAMIDGLIRLKRQHGIRPGSVQEVRAFVFPHTMEMAAKRRPRTGLEAKLSLYYCAAIALTEGRADEVQFADAVLERPDLVPLQEKVHGYREPSYPITRARVEVSLADGRTLAEEVDLLAGDPEPAAPRAFLEQKFESLAGTALPSRSVDELVRRLGRLQEETDLVRIMDLCRGDAPQQEAR